MNGVSVPQTPTAADGRELNAKLGLGRRMTIESMGVRIGVSTHSDALLDRFRDAIAASLPGIAKETGAEARADFEFGFVRDLDDFDVFYKNGEQVMRLTRRETSVESAASHVRLAVAENAPGRVFIHAGVVAMNGLGVIMPGSSFRGKTALTAELVRRGALYYSDEFAILDERADVHPFAKPLSVRGEVDPRVQIDHPVDDFGIAGAEPVEVGLVLFTEYVDGAKWRPRELTPAQGVIEMLKDAVSIRREPQFVLSVLGKLAESATFAKSKRGDLAEAADAIEDFIARKLSGRAG